MDIRTKCLSIESESELVSFKNQWYDQKTFAFIYMYVKFMHQPEEAALFIYLFIDVR